MRDRKTTYGFMCWKKCNNQRSFLKGLFVQCCYSEISLVMFVQSCLLMLDIDEKCGMPVPIHTVETHHSLSLPQRGCTADTTECKACPEDSIV